VRTVLLRLRLFKVDLLVLILTSNKRRWDVEFPINNVPFVSQ
jgi:hypothetical protein